MNGISVLSIKEVRDSLLVLSILPHEDTEGALYAAQSPDHTLNI